MSLREIVEAPNFKHDLDMYRGNFPQIDQIYLEAKVVLQEKPSEGETVEADFRRYLTYPTDDTPGFLIYYSYDLDHIYMHSIRKVAF